MMSSNIGQSSQIVLQCDQKPQSGIGGVVLGGYAVIGETIRHQAAVEVLRKGAQDLCADRGPTGGQRQSGQRDHRIPAPIAEPRVAGDDGRAVCETALPRCAPSADDELIRGQHQPVDPVRACAPGSVSECRLMIAQLRQCLCCGFGLRLYRRDDARDATRFEPELEEPGTVQILESVESALGFLAMKQIPMVIRGNVEFAAIGAEAQYPIAARRSDAAAVRDRLGVKPFGSAPLPVIVACRTQGAQAKAYGILAPLEGILNEAGVALARHEYAFDQACRTERIGPGWNAAIEVEALQQAETRGVNLAAAVLVAGELILSSADLDGRIEVDQKHNAASGRRGSRDQQPVVAARLAAGNGPCSEAPQPIRHQPLATQRLPELAANLAADGQARVHERRGRRFRFTVVGSPCRPIRLGEAI
jgi:hypothetical protein